MILQWTQPTLIDSCQWTKITSLKITKIHLSEASVHAGRTVGVRCTVLGPMCCVLSGHGAKYTPRPLMASVRGPGRRGRSREIFPVSVIKYGPSSSPDGPPEPTASLPVKGATGPK
jgi:hypothetical protein